jgi:hypothetical protein
MKKCLMALFRDWEKGRGTELFNYFNMSNFMALANYLCLCFCFNSNRPSLINNITEKQLAVD